MSAAHPVYMLDADAFLALRSLSLLTRVLATEALPRPVVLTEFIARHELSSIWNEIQIHVDAATLREQALDIDARHNRIGYTVPSRSDRKTLLEHLGTLHIPCGLVEVTIR